MEKESHVELINGLLQLCEQSQFDQIESAALLATSANILMHRYIDAEPSVKYQLAAEVAEMVTDGFAIEDKEVESTETGDVKLAIY